MADAFDKNMECFTKRGLYDRVIELEGKHDKLKRLLLLVDPVVSDVVMGDTQLKQWNEFIKCFPEEE